MSEPGERVYAWLPRPLQNLALSLHGARVARRRYGGDFDTILRAYEDRSTWTPGDMETFRDARLRVALAHAVSSAPFYLSAGYRSIREVETLADLAQLPIVDKPQIRDAGPQVFAELGTVRRTFAATSGTTGAGLRFPTTRQAMQEQWAVWWRYRHWHGIERDTWSAHVGGRNIATHGHTVWRVDRGQRRILLSAYHTSTVHLDEMIDVLNTRQPPWLHGYPSQLTVLAKRVLDRQTPLVYRVKWITTGAENLLPYQRATLREAFGVDPIQHFGAAEGVANASQCPMGELHIDEDFSAVEIVDDQLVGTSFCNAAFPLIRYRTGDTATLRPGVCECGRPGRLLDGLDGRLEDYLELADGSRLGRLDHVFKHSESVIGAQFIQTRPGAALLNIVPAPGFGSGDLQQITEEMSARVGDRLTLQIEMAEQLERSANGKARLVINRTARDGYESR